MLSRLAFEMGVQLKTAVQTGMPILAVDVSGALFDSMTKSGAWINDDDAWRTMLLGFPPQHTVYAQQIREAAAKRKAEGHHFILLCAVREERVQLITLQ